MWSAHTNLLTYCVKKRLKPIKISQNFSRGFTYTLGLRSECTTFHFKGEFMKRKFETNGLAAAHNNNSWIAVYARHSEHVHCLCRNTMGCRQHISSYRAYTLREGSPSSIRRQHFASSLLSFFMKLPRIILYKNGSKFRVRFFWGVTSCRWISVCRGRNINP